MGLYMRPEEVLRTNAEARKKAGEAIEAANRAVSALNGLEGTEIFGPSPAGKHVDTVFGLSARSIDELVTQINESVVQLTAAVHASANLVINTDESGQADYKKAEAAARSGAKNVEHSGIKPGTPGYVAPATGQNLTDGQTAPSGPGSTPAPSPATASS